MGSIKRNTQTDFYNKVADLLKEARKSVVQTDNKTMVYTYFEIGRMIVEEEQNGQKRAEFGKGFSMTNLKQMRQFYLTYSKNQTLSDRFEKFDIRRKRLLKTLSPIIIFIKKSFQQNNTKNFLLCEITPTGNYGGIFLNVGFSF